MLTDSLPANSDEIIVHMIFWNRVTHKLSLSELDTLSSSWADDVQEWLRNIVSGILSMNERDHEQRNYAYLFDTERQTPDNIPTYVISTTRELTLWEVMDMSEVRLRNDKH